MALPLISDLVGQQSVYTGTGNFVMTLVDGQNNFNSAFGIGPLFYYYILNTVAPEWELGIGMLSDTSTLVRETVLASSNSGSIVNFSAGLKLINSDFPAARQYLSQQPPRIITAAGPSSVLNTDCKIEIDQTIGAPFTLNFDPAVLYPGQEFFISDGKGDAGTNNISLVLASGVWNATGTNTYVMDNDGESVIVYCNGTNGRIF